MNTLVGLRVLIVDDEAIVGLYAEEILAELGAAPIATVATIDEANALIDANLVDVALLDVNLGTCTSEPIARRLHDRRIPFVVATGYGSIQWKGLDPVIVEKPYGLTQLRAALAKAGAKQSQSLDQ